MIINSRNELEAFCKKLSKSPYITVDTEFLRDKTYYPRLCLLQMAAPGVEAAAIDPIGTNLDWSCVFSLMRNKDIVKVFHAARQDLEIFYHMEGMKGQIPAPIFDTQIAAMVCGYGDSVSYASLVMDITGHALGKTSQFTDWAKRPLSKKQIDYAIADVTYLRDVYEHLSAELEKQGRKSWVREEMENLTRLDSYENDPEESWHRVKIRSDKPKVLMVLKDLAAWREREAKQRNVPRGRIIRDDALADIAVYMPETVDALERIRSLPRGMAKGKDGKAILDIVVRAVSRPASSYPKKKIKKKPSGYSKPVVEMLKMLLKINAAEAGVSSRIIASKDDLLAIATGESDSVLALKGWRYDIFGREALELVAGRLFLGIRNGRIHKEKHSS